MATMLERILGSKKTKEEDTTKATEAKVKERLKSLVYDDSLVEELLPVFMKLSTSDGFDKVIELLETKEKQIEAISGGDWFKQETDPETKVEQTEESSSDLVDDYLKTKYSKE